MKIMIEIDDNLYTRLFDNGVDNYDDAVDMVKAIRKGTPKPCEGVLDKIKAEIIEKFGNCSICEWFEDYDYDENDISEYISVGHISDVIDIIDKYRKGGAK